MSEPVANWYADPSGRFQWRYWDGSRWTEHVAVSGVQSIDPIVVQANSKSASHEMGSTSAEAGASAGEPRRNTRLLGLFGLLACVLAVAATAVPGVGYISALADDGVRLPDGPQHVALDPNRTYGIYVDDANNSGYEQICYAADDDGRAVPMKDAPWNIGFSATETLDLVFRAEMAELIINCSVPGEQVTARPVPNDKAMLLGLLVAGIFGVAGLALLVAWAATRRSRAGRSPLP